MKKVIRAGRKRCAERLQRVGGILNQVRASRIFRVSSHLRVPTRVVRITKTSVGQSRLHMYASAALN